jgi:hypothetical protein
LTISQAYKGLFKIRARKHTPKKPFFIFTSASVRNEQSHHLFNKRQEIKPKVTGT